MTQDEAAGTGKGADTAESHSPAVGDNGVLEDAVLPGGAPKASNGIEPSTRDDVEAASSDHDEPTETSPLLQPGSVTPASPRQYLIDTSPSRFWFVFLQVLTSQFLGCFDNTIMASSHPVITSYFGASNSASWLTTVFMLTSTAFQPVLGRLSDALGRKPLYVGCLGIFVLATLWCSLAQSIESFIVARAVCGLGAGGSMALGGIITSDIVPIERRGTFQSYINIVFGGGTALGAALGGVLADKLGWRWEFGVQIPPLVVCFIVSMFAIPKELGIYGPRKTLWTAMREFDFVGSLLLSSSVAFLILGLNLGGNVLPWSHPFVIASLVIFCVFFPTFIWVESRVKMPIMPLTLLRKPPRANVIFANFITAVLITAIMFNMPIYYQAVLLTSPSSSGLRLMVPSIAAFTTGTSVGFIITYTRRLKWPIMSGVLLVLLGTISLSLLRRTGLPPIVYYLVLLPHAFGQGFQFPATSIAILAASEQAEQAVVTSTLTIWRSMGFVLGVAGSSLILQNALVHYLDEFVVGDRKSDVIEKVRASVEAIAKLEDPYREQVLSSYEAALRLTFICCAVVAACSVVLIAPVKLPRLPQRGK